MKAEDESDVALLERKDMLSQLRCPITRELMVDPVIAEDEVSNQRGRL